MTYLLDLELPQEQLWQIGLLMSATTSDQLLATPPSRQQKAGQFKQSKYMKLLTPTEFITSSMATDTNQLASYLQNAIILSNRIAKYVLDLPTDQLNIWLNARSLEQRMGEFATHLNTGNALNDVAELVEIITGKDVGGIGRVDVRSAEDKLANQGRILNIIDNTFVVVDRPIVIEDTVVEQPPTAIEDAPTIAEESPTVIENTVIEEVVDNIQSE